MKNYKKQRYCFFYLTIAAYFLPYIAVTAALLPFTPESQGVKWGAGVLIVLLNALPFAYGVFHRFLAKVPFINFLAVVFVALSGFFSLDFFADYVYTFAWIEAAAAVGSVAACTFWLLHLKYKRQAQTVETVKKSGLLDQK